MLKSFVTIALVGGLAPTASADLWPHADGSMKHIMVSLDGQTLGVHIEGDPMERMEMLRYPGEHYTPPADVLDGKYYSSRYGWMSDGFIDLPDGAAIFVLRHSSDAGLEVYEGGMRSMISTHTFAPILGTAGHDEPWPWPGSMVHNWYAAQALGDYEATYDVYVGDELTGEPLDGYSGDRVTVYFTAVPAPAGAAALGLGALWASRRRAR